MVAKSRAQGCRITRRPSGVIDQPRTSGICSKPMKTALMRELGRYTLDASVSVKPDPTLEGAVARATWTGGGLDLDFERAARECLAVFESALKEFGSEKQS